MTSTNLRGALLLTALVCASGCALIDGLTGDPTNTQPDADMSLDLDMSASPDADMSPEEDTPVDAPPSDMDMAADPDISLDMFEDMSEDMSDMVDMSPPPAEPPLHTVAVGSLSTCALKANKVYCWGENNGGLLGVGSMTRRVITPTQVNLGADAVAITGGSAHFCALLVGGALKCWGDGGQGRLGDNTTTPRTAPVQVMGLTAGVRAVEAGAGYTCALLADGSLKCWGANFSNQLGSNQSGNKAAPTPVIGLEADVSTFSAGASHTCAVHDGALKCWGDNERGQLGNGMSGDTATIPTAVKVLGLGVTAVSAGGQHTCAIQRGALYCWGNNADGQLGTMGGPLSEPAPVPGMERDVTAVSAGANHTCAVRSGVLLCWGDDRARQLGTGLPNPRPRGDGMLHPVQDFGNNTSEVVAGDTHTCAWRDGQLSCWGSNLSGQLAQPTLESRIIPTAVQQFGAPPNSFSLIQTGQQHTCGVVAGAALCWGDGRLGELGDGASGTDYERALPGAVDRLDDQVSALSAGDNHTCGIRGGLVYCWGRNLSGQLGTGNITDSPTPQLISRLQAFGTATHVAAGESHSCAVVAGKLYCWGASGGGQLGGATPAVSGEPALVPTMDADVTAVVAAASHTCAIKAGALYCWGRNDSGQLGTGSRTVMISTPTIVTGLTSQVTAVATGSSHTCALHQDTVKCWGSGSRGKLGDNTTVERLIPVAVMGPTETPTAIAVGDQHSCAVWPSGARCWGSNAEGQLGNNDTNASRVNRLVPELVAGPLTNIASLTAAGTHTCAARTTGEALCWGSNAQGQLGSGLGSSFGPVGVALP